MDDIRSADAVWSPDGSRLAYLVGSKHIVVRAVNGATPIETYLGEDPAFKTLSGWTPDGQYLVYSRQDPATRNDVWLLPMTGDHKPRLYYASPYNDFGSGATAAGRWMVINSDETGKKEGVRAGVPRAGHEDAGDDRLDVSSAAGANRSLVLRPVGAAPRAS